MLLISLIICSEIVSNFNTNNSLPLPCRTFFSVTCTSKPTHRYIVSLPCTSFCPSVHPPRLNFRKKYLMLVSKLYELCQNYTMYKGKDKQIDVIVQCIYLQLIGNQHGCFNKQVHALALSFYLSLLFCYFSLICFSYVNESYMIL